jgi:uncharacterized protein YjiS (DUF1127 family)
MAKGDSIMERFSQSSIPAIGAAHIAALTTASVAPAFRDAGLAFRWRVNGPQGDFADTAWRPSPRSILQGWQPRQSEELPAQRWRARVGEALVAFFDQVAEWHQRAKSRQALLSMNDHALRDIGVDQATADHEGNLPFWRQR